MRIIRNLTSPLILFGLLLSAVLIVSCGKESPTSEDQVDNYDRSLMLSNWADNLIIPAFDSYLNSLNDLSNAVNTFNNEATIDNLNALQSQWLVSYKAWQRVSMYDIGKAEEIGLRNFTNVYPVDVAGIENNITTSDFNLELPSSFDEQGFAAIDYLIHDIDHDDTMIVNRYDSVSGEAYRAYLSRITDRLAYLADLVVQDWKTQYRSTFKQNSGSSATASVNKVINDYLFYYEKFLRAGKIGIPAGVFSSSTLPDRVEAYYAQEVSKELYLESLDAAQDFFNGVSFDGTTTGDGLSSYLDYLDGINDYQTNLSEMINAQFDNARVASQALDNNLASQVITDNSMMLKVYDELQKNVILMKVDMLQALNVKVDYVDADGD